MLLTNIQTFVNESMTQLHMTMKDIALADILP